MDCFEGLNGGGGEFLKLPVGKELTVTFEQMTRVEDRPDWNYKKKDGTNLGFYNEMICVEGVLTINAICLGLLIKGLNLETGDKVHIKHTGHGAYKVEKL